MHYIHGSNNTLLLHTVPSISIVIDDNGANPAAGLNYNFSCKVSGIDGNLSTVSYVIEWKKDDTPLSETGPLLSFSPLKLSDTGEYSCTINIHGCSFKHSKDLSRMEGTKIHCPTYAQCHAHTHVYYVHSNTHTCTQL